LKGKKFLPLKLDNEPLDEDLEPYIRTDWTPAPKPISQEVLSEIKDSVSRVLNQPLEPPGPQPNLPTAFLSYPPETPFGPSILFDIGTILGLDRGSFIGLLSGTTSDQLLHVLANSERSLHDALARNPTNLRFPPRWWVPIRWEKHPNGPNGMEQLWESVIRRHGVNTGNIEFNGLPADALAGFILEIEFRQENGSEQRSVSAWCEALLGRMFSEKDVAVLIVTNPQSRLGLSKSIRSLAEMLQKKLPEIRTEILDVVQKFDILGLKNTVTDEDGKKAITGTGAYLLWWIDKATRMYSHSFAWPEFEKSINDLLKLKAALTESLKLPDLGSEKLLVADLDSDGFSLEPKLYRQIFLMLDLCFPRSLRYVIWGCARSNSEGLRKAALLYAKKSEELMDAWVAGTGLEVHRLPRKDALDADPEFGPLVDQLALALIRSRMNGISSETSEEYILKTLMPLLSSSLQAVASLAFGSMEEKVFLTKFRSKEFMLALRADYEFHHDKVILANEASDEWSPDRWWLILAMPPTVDCVARVLTMSLEERAVFGICSREEWRRLSKNLPLMETINVRRRFRRLTFAAWSMQRGPLP
jgi:hypothetical protein